jgi:hypothetical protein
MAKAATGKPPKPTREQKKLTRAAGRQKRREGWNDFWGAFKLTRQEDPRFIPYLVLAGVVAGAAVFTVTYLITHKLYIAIPTTLIGMAVAMMALFSQRVQRMTFTKAEGQLGAAQWVLQNRMRGDWRTEEAIAANAQMDLVHRVIGRPGVVLVGEGSPPRVRVLIAQEKKKIARVAGETPIYDFVVGTEDGTLPLRKLSTTIAKLPRNLDKSEVAALEKRLAALGVRRAPLPQGPMPAGAKTRNVQRAVRRRS